MDKEQVVYDVEGEITFQNDGWRSEVNLVLSDTKLSVCGRKKRDVVVRLTHEQWKTLARLVPEQEHQRYILETAAAEMAERRKRHREDLDEYRLELIHKLGLGDVPSEELPYCLRSSS